MYTLRRNTILPTTIDKAWEFFSDPRNLTYITPPEMEFQIKTHLRPGEFYTGMNIEYVVRPVAGIPFRWVSEIQAVEAPVRFSDIQIVGPYKKWYHRHEFIAVDDGVEMTDIVEYEMPYGWFGNLMHRLLVRRKLEHIFNYRARRIEFLFSEKRAGVHMI